VRLLHAVTNNLALKISALVLALIFWSLVRAESLARRPIAGVPVVVEVRDVDWRLARPPQPGSVEVTVSGPWRQLLQLRGENTRIVVPVEDVTDTTELRVLSRNWVHLDDEQGRIRVEDVSPNTVSLRYEPLETRTIPVAPTTTGELPAGFVLEPPLRASPSAVQVRGGVAAVNALDSLRLLPIDLSRIRGVTSVPTAVDTAQVRGLAISPLEVTVLVRVAPVTTDSLTAASRILLPFRRAFDRDR
jgi:YbbR domain-containing protein